MSLLAAALLQTTAPAPAPPQWQFVGSSEAVAHYVDAASVQQLQTPWRTATTRLVRFGPDSDSGANMWTIVVNCADRYYVRREFRRIEGDRVSDAPPDLFANVRVPANIYPMAAAAIELVCDGRAQVAVADPVADAPSRRPPENPRAGSRRTP